MYVKRGLGAESLARIFASLSRPPVAGRGVPDRTVVRLPRRPETSGKRRVA